ncbi:MAG: winged helix-turn-helix domain-containing protein [Fusobacteria bacterium]|nr:winged helix-turn-helix domain-containing protein [Fusobacteriota bacterium]
MRYDNIEIGKNTGELWKYLEENPKSSLRQLVRETKIPKNDILLALGWLFKEDKIISEETKREIFFSLK